MTKVLHNYYQRKEFIIYLERWLLKPYAWAGDDFSAIDCSGLIVEGGKMLGWWHEDYDISANGMYQLFKNKELKKPYKPYIGCLVFWFNSRGVSTHVAVMKDHLSIIHAAGGGSTTTTLAESIRKNAYVKQRNLEKEIERRRIRYAQAYKIVDPFAK